MRLEIPIGKSDSKNYISLISSPDFEDKIKGLRKKYKISKVCKSLTLKKLPTINTDKIVKSEEFVKDVKNLLLSWGLGKKFYDNLIQYIFHGFIKSTKNVPALIIEVEPNKNPEFYLKIFPDTNCSEINKNLSAIKKIIKKFGLLERKGDGHFVNTNREIFQYKPREVPTSP